MLSESYYEETVGNCRGGENWPGLSTTYYCILDSDMSLEECQSECDGSADCGAFDLPATDPPSGKCCLFKEGNTGNGSNNRKCFVEIDEIPEPGISLFHSQCLVPRLSMLCHVVSQSTLNVKCFETLPKKH